MWTRCWKQQQKLSPILLHKLVYVYSRKHRTLISTDLLKFRRLCQRWDLKFLMFWASSRIRYRQDFRLNAWWSCSTNLYEVMQTWKALGFVQPYKNKQKVTINIIITIILNWKKKIGASVLVLGRNNWQQDYGLVMLNM